MIDNQLFTNSDAVVADLRAGSPKQLFQEIATRLIAQGDLESKGIACRDIVAAAMERERLGSTGVGNGVALPHARIKSIETVMAAFVRLETPIDFDAIDERPVDLVAFLLAPEAAAGAHLRALAKVSRTLRRQDVRERLRLAPNSEALFTILSERESAAAA